MHILIALQRSALIHRSRPPRATYKCRRLHRCQCPIPLPPLVHLPPCFCSPLPIWLSALFIYYSDRLHSSTPLPNLHFWPPSYSRPPLHICAPPTCTQSAPLPLFLAAALARHQSKLSSSSFPLHHHPFVSSSDLISYIIGFFFLIIF